MKLMTDSQQSLIETLDDSRLEAWFAEAGLVARVVERCPLPGCALCAPAADLAPAA